MGNYDPLNYAWKAYERGFRGFLVVHPSIKTAENFVADLKKRISQGGKAPRRLRTLYPQEILGVEVVRNLLPLLSQTVDSSETLCVLLNVDRVQTSAVFDQLLKPIEDLAGGVTLFLLTARPYATVPATLRSRLMTVWIPQGRDLFAPWPDLEEAVGRDFIERLQKVCLKVLRGESDGHRVEALLEERQDEQSCLAVLLVFKRLMVHLLRENPEIGRFERFRLCAHHAFVERLLGERPIDLAVLRRAFTFPFFWNSLEDF